MNTEYAVRWRSSRDDLIVKKEDDNIAKSITKIEDIRKTVSQIKDVNTALEKLIPNYESTFSPDDRLVVQKKISNVIERGNSVAASSRVRTIKKYFHSLPFKHLSLTITIDCEEVFLRVYTSRSK